MLGSISGAFVCRETNCRISHGLYFGPTIGHPRFSVTDFHKEPYIHAEKAPVEPLPTSYPSSLGIGAFQKKEGSLFVEGF